MNVNLMASILAGLSPFHEDFVVRVVDAVLEEVRVGLEENNSKQNQRRIAVVRYVGELYNYEVINSDIVFSTMYSLISFGHGSSMISFLDFVANGSL